MLTISNESGNGQKRRKFPFWDTSLQRPNDEKPRRIAPAGSIDSD